MRKDKTSRSMGIAALCLCSTAFGADLPDTSAKTGSVARDSEVIETVVVTAERRSTSLQKMPLSIQAFTAETLEKTGTGSNIDLQMHTPGLVVTDQVGFGQIYIRGIGSDIIGTGVDNAVALYVDGVYQARPMGAMLNFVDVERIEVLKGPQGTLYGRNATGGAINIISKAPSRESEGQVDLQFGSYSQRILRGTVSGPLSEGVAYGRLSAVFNKDDGYTKNILLNTRGNNNDIQAVRGALELTPTAALNVVVNAHYYESNTAPMYKSLNALINPAYTKFNATWIPDPYTVMNNTQGNVQTKQYGVDATIKYDMGWAQLTSVTAVRKDTLFNKNDDMDGTEINFLILGGYPGTAGSPEKTDFFSQDITLTSNTNGPLQWTTLASFMHQKTDYKFGLQLPLLKVATYSIGDLTTDALGIGGQVSYALANDVTLTAGTRYSKETKENNDVFTTNNSVTARQNEQKTWTAWTPKIVAEYAATKRVMLYTSVTKGFKSGGFNTYSFGPAWSPEKVTNYEAGMKSTWFDGRFRLNAAAFNSQYDQLQLQFTTKTPAGALVGITTNAAKATSKGVELDFVAKLTSRFEITGGLQILNARFDDYITTNPLNQAAGAVNQAGNPLLRAPDTTFNIGMQYKWPSAFEGKDVTLRADGYHRSKMYYTAFKDGLASEELDFLGNVQLSFEPTGNRGMYGAAFIKNLTDKRYHTNIFASATGGYIGYMAPPRTVGVQLGYRY